MSRTHHYPGVLIRFEVVTPIIAAAALAFGFVYIHPFEDGNGRIHRYLIHHVLAKHGFSPPGAVFPISSVILDELEQYREMLESYSERLLSVIEWQPTSKGNVEVKSDTADFYRFFDATPHAEFLADCILRKIEKDLPKETFFLKCHDAAMNAIQNQIEMPDRLADQLILLIRQNEGKLSKKPNLPSRWMPG